MKKLILVLGFFVLLFFSAAMTYADHITIGPGAFTAQDETTDYRVAAGGSYLELVSGTNGNFHAQVFLPQGAKINGIFAFYTDNSAGSLVCDLIRVNVGTAMHQTMFRVGPTSGATAGVRWTADWKIDAGQRYVKNEAFAYNVYVFFSTADPTNLRFHGVRIHYTI